MDTPGYYSPIDRRHALARGQTLPERAEGAALFADISGFTPLTEALALELGPKRGAEELFSCRLARDLGRFSTSHRVLQSASRGLGRRRIIEHFVWNRLKIIAVTY